MSIEQARERLTRIFTEVVRQECGTAWTAAHGEILSEWLSSAMTNEHALAMTHLTDEDIERISRQAMPGEWKMS